MFRLSLVVLTLSAVFAACPTDTSAGWDPQAVKKAEKAVAEFIEADEGLQAYFDSAYAYAVFPSVGKGAIGIGGAYGTGTVFVGKQVVGKTDLKQVTLGLQLGGQAYREAIFFEDKEAFENFKNGNLKLSAQASAVAAKAGASADLAYKNGIAIATMAKGGLMYEASVGGQHFAYEPIEKKADEQESGDSEREKEKEPSRKRPATE